MFKWIRKIYNRIRKYLITSVRLWNRQNICSKYGHAWVQSEYQECPAGEACMDYTNHTCSRCGEIDIVCGRCMHCQKLR